MDEFIFILELIGTVAFASSGAMIAIEKKMDIFGVNVLGATTAVGGGIMRDIILGLTPPGAFSHPVYVLVAALTSTILFVIAYAKPTAFESRVKTDYYDKLMFWCDTAGSGDTGGGAGRRRGKCVFLCIYRNAYRSRRRGAS